MNIDSLQKGCTEKTDLPQQHRLVFTMTSGPSLGIGAVQGCGPTQRLADELVAVGGGGFWTPFWTPLSPQFLAQLLMGSKILP